ncbi:BTB/POZ protein [Rhizophagus irregularis DAOM 181602=DAOM 197198]|nr:BTB/POZ protein [Rhizophagus irregularis DAOM 181602=DAOM 197198]
MSRKFVQEVVNDLEKLLTTEKGYDVIIYAGENENIRELHAHSDILCTRSQYFSTAFSNELAEKKDGKFIFKKPNLSAQLFKIILRFIYCGKIDLKELQGPEVLKLLIVVDEFNIQSLISYIQNYLIKNQDEFLQQDPRGILEAVYQHESFTDLWNHCLEKICQEPKILFESDKFTSLKAPLLKLLLEKDYLDLEEIFIWESLLKWGLAQNPSISKDITKWNKEDITIIERTLHGLIPLVRYYHISSDDFLDKIYPLKKLLPKDLTKDLVEFYIAPNRKPNIVEIQSTRIPKHICDYDSILIKNHHFAVFAIGGYNPLKWNSSNKVESTKDSYIYLFTDGTDTKSAKVSYSNGDQNSIRNLAAYGPGFGGGTDLLCWSNGSWLRNSALSYPKIDGIPEKFFNVDDYEVYQVIKK